MQLENKVCIVTGAANGIGRQTAETFAREGAHVALVDIQIELANEVSSKINETSKNVSKAYQCNLRSVNEIRETIEKIHKDFLKIDVLVNVAGLANRTSNEEITEEEWDLLNDVNLKAVFFMGQAAYRIMLKQKYGKIINLASQRAHTTDGSHTIYDATKAGVQAVTRGLAVTGGRKGICTNTVTPGYVITPMTAHNLENEGWLTHMQERVPLGRLIEMQEVANVITFIASDNCSGVNGQNFIVDGGWTVHE